MLLCNPGSLVPESFMNLRVSAIHDKVDIPRGAAIVPDNYENAGIDQGCI
jgi:hypothetical protein